MEPSVVRLVNGNDDLDLDGLSYDDALDNFRDEAWDVTDEQRALLKLYGMDNVDGLTEVQVTRAFKRRIRRETSELEQDIQGGSRG